MSAAAQAITNKENAQHSTGPRTEQGKRTSSLNALRHGLTSQTVVLPTEDAEAYALLQSTVQADLSPKGIAEEILAQTITDTQWRLERARNLEANLLALARYEDIPEAIAQIEDAQHRNALIEAHGYAKREKTLHNLQLQEARLQRTLFKAMKELRELQSARQAAAAAHLEEAVVARILCKQRNLPFNAAELGFDFTDQQLEAETLLRQARGAVHKPRPC